MLRQKVESLNIDNRIPLKPKSRDAGTAEFLADLTELSLQHGIAINVTGEAVLFTMEPEDYDAAYKMDPKGRLGWGG